MRDLSERVHARIGPSRAVQLELLSPRDVSNGALDLTRNGFCVLLNLPAAVPRAGVFDD
jgi:hypothetical protein